MQKKSGVWLGSILGAAGSGFGNGMGCGGC